MDTTFTQKVSNATTENSNTVNNSTVTRNENRRSRKPGLIRRTLGFLITLVFIVTVSATASIVTTIVLEDVRTHGHFRGIQTVYTDTVTKLTATAPAEPENPRTITDDLKDLWKGTCEYAEIGWQATCDGYDWAAEKAGEGWDTTCEAAEKGYNWIMSLFSADEAEGAQVRDVNINDVFGGTWHDIQINPIRNTVWAKLHVLDYVQIEDPSVYVVDRSGNIVDADGLNEGTYLIAKLETLHGTGEQLKLSELIALHCPAAGELMVKYDADTPRLIVRIFLSASKFIVPDNTVEVIDVDKPSENFYFGDEIVNTRFQSIGWVLLRMNPVR